VVILQAMPPHFPGGGAVEPPVAIAGRLFGHRRHHKHDDEDDEDLSAAAGTVRQLHAIV
jgi:hypothetical protein